MAASSSHLRLSPTLLVVVLLPWSFQLTSPLSAQTRQIPGGTTEAEVVANAQTDGAKYPRSQSPREPSPNFAKVQDGSVERRCVEGSEVGPIRSGEFVIGGQLGGSRAMPAGERGKIWWAPLSHSTDVPPLEVRGRSLVQFGDTLRFTTKTVAFPVDQKEPRIPASEREWFFPSGIILPTSGRWLLVASSGENWGCFIVTAKYSR